MWPFLLLFVKKDVAEILIPHITFFFPPSSTFSFSDTKSQSNLLVWPSPLLRLSLSQVHLQPTNPSCNGNFCHRSLFFFPSYPSVRYQLAESGIQFPYILLANISINLTFPWHHVHVPICGLESLPAMLITIRSLYCHKCVQSLRLTLLMVCRVFGKGPICFVFVQITVTGAQLLGLLQMQSMQCRHRKLHFGCILSGERFLWQNKPTVQLGQQALNHHLSLHSPHPCYKIIYQALNRCPQTILKD